MSSIIRTVIIESQNTRLIPSSHQLTKFTSFFYWCFYLHNNKVEQITITYHRNKTLITLYNYSLGASSLLITSWGASNSYGRDLYL